MAKYNITHACGHTATKQLTGSHKDRDSYIRWAEGQPCPSCRDAARDQARQAENAEAAEANAAAGLPALVGSDRQVPWAEAIRAKALENARAVAPAALREGAAEALGITRSDAEARIALANTRIDEARRKLETETAARWWIDNRDQAETLVADAKREGLREAVADLQAEADRRKAEADAQRAAEAAERVAQERAQREEERMREEVRAHTFRVGVRPDSVEARPYRAGGDLIIKSRDGREARGYIDQDGEWVVTQLGTHTGLPSTHPELERIAREARNVYDTNYTTEEVQHG